jgi:carbon storage regulator
MLVLSRKRGERIVIPGCAVTITIAAIKGNQVRLGIAAPAEVAILREELARRKRRSEAAETKSSNPADRR